MKRILLAEDEVVLSEPISDLLTAIFPVEVLVAQDGAEAIRMAQEHLPDLILMDLNLPRIDGWEATRSLRQYSTFKDTPILAISAHAMAEERQRALQAGCNAFYSKPIDIDEFIEFIRPYLT